MNISTERLNLVHVCKHHAEGLLKIWSDKDVIRYTNTRLKTNILECEKYIDTILKIQEEQNFQGGYTVFYKDKIIGFIGAPLENKYTNSYNLFYQIHKGYWGKGYGLEAARGLMNYMFENQEAKEICADTVCTNKPSINILKRLGMNRIGVEENGFVEGKTTLDIYNYSICRNEWEG